MTILNTNISQRMFSKTALKVSAVLFSLILVASCTQSGSEKETAFDKSIVSLANEGQYIQAMEQAQQLRTTNQKQARATFAEIKMMLEEDLESAHSGSASDQHKTDAHFYYGLYLEYYASEMEMRPRMTNALKHFRKVLELAPDHQRAKAEINQIESVYESMNRPIPDGVAE